MAYNCAPVGPAVEISVREGTREALARGLAGVTVFDRTVQGRQKDARPVGPTSLSFTSCVP
jgi:hypothetical protein